LIQENENYQQRGFGKFLDTVLSNYGMGGKIIEHAVALV
jgi:hypothetical protein